MRIFTGWDAREEAGWHAFAHSVVKRASVPVALTPITAQMQRDGSNAFTYSRFLVPYLCDFYGRALFVDGADMLAMGDVAELARLACKPVHVVKHDYKTKHPVKYVGTEMEAKNEDYPRKNWSSVILWDCGHPLNRCLTPEFIEDSTGSFLHRFGWLPDDMVGELPQEWNWLCDEYGANTRAKLLHFTAGIPAIEAYRHSPHAEEWFEASKQANRVPARKAA